MFPQHHARDCLSLCSVLGVQILGVGIKDFSSATPFIHSFICLGYLDITDHVKPLRAI